MTPMRSGSPVPVRLYVAADRDGELFEVARTAQDVEVLRGAEPVLRDIETRGAIPEDDQAIRIGVGQRTQQKGVGDAENGGIGSDGEGQRDNRGGRKGGRLAQPARGVAEIGEHHFSLRVTKS